MEVIIIDDTHQSFNGVTYHRHNQNGYYINMNRKLHRDVWSFHNGTIPPKHDVHHIDFNKNNNQIENLQLMTSSEHRSLHAKINAKKRSTLPPNIRWYKCSVCGKEFKAKGKAKYCPQCRKERDKAQAKARYDAAKKAKEPKPPKEPRLQTCVVCGKVFELKATQSRTKGPKTCSDECHQKLRIKLDDKTCPVCGKTFHPEHATQQYCSPKCRQIGQRGAKVERVVSHCEFCGKEIIHRPSKKPRFCSRSCLGKFYAAKRRQ